MHKKNSLILLVIIVALLLILLVIWIYDNRIKTLDKKISDPLFFVYSIIFKH